ncbi:deoxyribose-phosphate aldolase [Tenacibaculum sp. 190524A02b]|uniref:Deoxyribose-phosphate aldolase n=1 Tax=Tenacibaculum vairaonense TaxID=3137860 RepID=A0ABM9PKC6_9FLAO
MDNINQYIDHTLLKATATQKDIIHLCKEAKTHNFYAVCVNGSYVALAKEELKGSNVKVAAVVGFPLGAMCAKSKIFEARQAVVDGAEEIDMVINIGNLLDGEYEKVEEEIRQVKLAIGHYTLKVIFENCYLTQEQIKKVSQLAINAGADFIKTSTGFGTNGATVEDVTVMKEIAKNKIEIKAAGGIRDIATAQTYIKIGVTRLGTSSGVALVTEGNIKDGSY